MNKKNRNNMYKAVVAIAVALAFLTPGAAAIANESENTFGDTLANTIVSISPSTQDVEKGETFTVDIFVEPGEPIVGMNVGSLSFDSTLIHAVSVTEGDLFAGITTFFMPGNIDNVTGDIAGISVVTLPPTTVSAPGTFCTIEFTAQDQFGTSVLDLEGVAASDINGDPVLTVVVNDGEVVIPIPQYTLTINLVGVGDTDPAPGVHVYNESDNVLVTAIETGLPDWVFASWSGDVVPGTETDNPVNILMDADKEITATFSGLGWSALLNFEAQISSTNTDTVVFGEDVGASDGIDGMDLVKPDAPPAPFIYAFLATSLSEPFNVLWEEFRFYDDTNDLQIFDLIVETDTAGGPETVTVTITWDNTTLATVTQYDHIGLYDVVSGDLLEDMKSVGTHVFTADSGMANHFQIICSDNHAPVAVPDSYETMESHELVVAAPGVLANDVDVDGDPLTAVVPPETGVSDGILTLHADGSFEYMPDLGFFGTDSFTYKANDGALDSNIVTVTIEVLELNHIGLQAGWNLISMPVGESIDKTDILVRFGGSDCSWNDAVGTIIEDPTFGWNGGMYTSEIILVPGEGYWMWSYETCELLIPSNAEADNHITNLDLGWNLAGIPYGTSLTKAEVNVYFNGELHTWANAVALGIILDPVFDWDRTNQNYAPPTDTFVPGFGYWVYAFHGCALKRA